MERGAEALPNTPWGLLGALSGFLKPWGHPPTAPHTYPFPAGDRTFSGLLEEAETWPSPLEAAPPWPGS